MLPPGGRSWPEAQTHGVGLLTLGHMSGTPRQVHPSQAWPCPPSRLTGPETGSLSAFPGTAIFRSFSTFIHLSDVCSAAVVCQASCCNPCTQRAGWCPAGNALGRDTCRIWAVPGSEGPTGVLLLLRILSLHPDFLMSSQGLGSPYTPTPWVSYREASPTQESHEADSEWVCTSQAPSLDFQTPTPHSGWFTEPQDDHRGPSDWE